MRILSRLIVAALVLLAPGLVYAQAVHYTAAPARAIVETEVTGYSVDQNIKAATANYRLLGFSVLETGAGIGYGAIRGTPGGAGACTGKVYAYFYTASNGAMTVDFGDRGVDASSGVCIDRIAGTWSVSLRGIVEP